MCASWGARAAAPTRSNWPPYNGNLTVIQHGNSRRYYKNPCSLTPYSCPVTYSVPPLGGLTGETEGTFPVGPFVLPITKE